MPNAASAAHGLTADAEAIVGAAAATDEVHVSDRQTNAVVMPLKCLSGIYWAPSYEWSDKQIMGTGERAIEDETPKVRRGSAAFTYRNDAPG